MYFDVTTAFVAGLSAASFGKEWLTDLPGSATEIQNPRKGPLSLAVAALAVGLNAYGTSDLVGRTGGWRADMNLSHSSLLHKTCFAPKLFVPTSCDKAASHGVPHGRAP